MPCYGVLSNYKRTVLVRGCEVVERGRVEQTRPDMCWTGQCYLLGELEAYLRTPQNEYSSPPLMPVASVSLLHRNQE